VAIAIGLCPSKTNETVGTRSWDSELPGPRTQSPFICESPSINPVDVGGAYNTAFLTIKHAGARTSLIVDPPTGRIPPLTPEAQKAAAADREFRLALLLSTDACKNHEPVCAGGKYDPTPSPRFSEPPPRYHAGNFVRFNRSDGPEDDGLADRCLHSGLPDFGSLFGGSFRRIVQTPGGISMYYDLNQGQGWQRNIVMNDSPHLPVSIRQWFGDSRGHWEGNTLVVDVTNFSPKGSRENLHLIERWTRTGPRTLAYEVTMPCASGIGEIAKPMIVCSPSPMASRTSLTQCVSA
jgi:hypothetical protein